MRIALVAFHFKPDEAVGSIRVENWARWLAESHEVTVVTRERLDRLQDERTSYAVLRPTSRLTRLLDRLNAYRKTHRCKLEALLEGARTDEQSPPPPKRTTGAFSYRMPCLYDFWLLASFRALGRLRPDLIIATHSPYVSLVAAYLYVLLHPRTKLLVDFRDLWCGNHIMTGIPLVRGIERWIERRVLSKASCVTSVSDGLCGSLQALGARHVKTIYNSPLSESLVHSSAAKENAATDKIAIAYTGTVYAGWRDPSPLFALLASLDHERRVTPDRLCIRLVSREPGDFLRLAAQYGVEKYVVYLGAVSREAAIAVQRKADILLLMESDRTEARGVLTGKVFEYLATDKPILLIGPGPDSELYQLLERHNRRIDLAGLSRILRNEAPLPSAQPVSYSKLAKEQLLKVVGGLAGAPAHGGASHHVPCDGGVK
jgi:glycosyltransferase involved in cell wall biosynthesis